MTITAEELRTIGNERTGRAESQADIDKFIKSCVQDLTTRGIVLEAEEEETLVDEQPDYVEVDVLTNSFRKIDVITIEDTEENEGKPLIEISWQRYKERIAYSVSPGQPKEYARFNGILWLWPAPDTDSWPKMNVSGTIYHAASTTISFADRFKECLIQYVIFKIYEKYGLTETKGKAPASLFKDQFDILLGDQNTKEINVVRYNDI